MTSHSVNWNSKFRLYFLGFVFIILFIRMYFSIIPVSFAHEVKNKIFRIQSYVIYDVTVINRRQNTDAHGDGYYFFKNWMQIVMHKMDALGSPCASSIHMPHLSAHCDYSNFETYSCKYILWRSRLLILDWM